MKISFSFIKKFLQLSYFKLTLIIILGYLVIMIWNPTVGQITDLKLYDLMLQARGVIKPGPEVVIVAIDEPSVKALGRWPWSRRVITRLVDCLQTAAARSVGFDIIYAEKEEESGVRILEKLRQEAKIKGWKEPALEEWVRQELKSTDPDGELVKAIQQNGNIVLGYFFDGLEKKAAGESVYDLKVNPELIKTSAYSLVHWLSPGARHFPLVTAEGIQLNISRLTQAAADSGYFNAIPDIDGTIRWAPLAIRFDKELYAPLSISIIKHFLGNPPLNLFVSEQGITRLRLGDKQIPVDAYGRFWINFRGPARTFPHYSFVDVIEGRIPLETFRDKIVLVGATAIGIYDMRVTPFASVYPGVEVHANIIDNILRGDFIWLSSGLLGPAVLLMIALSTLLGWCQPRLRALPSFLLFLGLVLMAIWGSFYFFTASNIYLPLVYPLSCLITVYVGVGLKRFLAEETERKRIKTTFQSFVAPEVVNIMLRHPEKLRLGGERKELTVIFTDIRGFTTISEDMQPEALVDMLHSYLTPMTEIVIQHKGTMDKYIGDAVMAVYGAPLDLPDHADRACSTALEMIESLKKLCRAWQSKGWPELRIGVGINSGVMTVGNMGSERLFDYTVIGDHVNLAARLEGLNKYYGTMILASEFTAHDLQDSYILREVDRVKVKGKKAPVSIFEVRGLGQPTEEEALFLDTFQAGLSAFRQRRWQEAEKIFFDCLELCPDDGPAQLLLERCHHFLLSPPPPDWDGTATMTEK
jgi:adenylate cyclase